MKNLYLKNKGKVYPSPSSSSSLSPAPKPTNTDSALSVLKFLPAAILALASILSLQDREVLAYLITTNPSSIIEDKRRKCKKPAHTHVHTPHKAPLFECGCFECYTSYWFRWDSSPNRELIHQVIEAFEDHLTDKGKSSRSKKRDKDKVFDKTPEKLHKKNAAEMNLHPHPHPQTQMVASEAAEEAEEVVVVDEKMREPAEEVAAEGVGMGVGGGGGGYNHKGLARKVLPDVMGLFNSRIWNLWSNNI